MRIKTNQRQSPLVGVRVTSKFNAATTTINAYKEKVMRADVAKVRRNDGLDVLVAIRFDFGRLNESYSSTSKRHAPTVHKLHRRSY